MAILLNLVKNPLNDLREEREIRNRAVVAKIGKVNALFLQQKFDDGFFQVEWNRPTSQRLCSDVGDDRYNY